jgi:CHAT domain-containing protein/Tfp pilus assembly protein PilF
MYSFVLSVLLCALPLHWRPFQSAQEAVSDNLNPGVLVEKVAKSSEAADAGLAAGDIILRWSRDDNSGTIDSPLDLSKVELEQVPLGKVTLAGKSGNKDKTWTWIESKTFAMREGGWGITTRPNLMAHLLSTYQTGLDAAEKGQAAGALASWQNAAAEAQSQHLPAWLAAWFLLRSAQVFAEASQWAPADTACLQAVQIGATSPSATQIFAACGYLFYQKNQHDQAEKYYQQALSSARQSDPQSLTAAAILNYQGRMALGREELDKAQDLVNAALQILEKRAPGSLTCASLSNRAGYMFQARGELEQSERYLRQGLAIRERSAPDSAALAQSLQNLGDTLIMHGDLAEAESFHLRALSIWERVQPNSSYHAGLLVDLSSGADARGDLAKAEEYLHQALEIQRKLQPRGPGTAASLNNLGLILQERGQLAEAEESFEQSLAIKEELAPDSLNVAITLGNIGSVLLERGDLAKAESYLRRSLAIREKVVPKSAFVGIAYSELGDLFRQRHDLVQAEDYYRKALAVQEATAPGGRETADAWQNLGDTAWEKGDNTEAERNYLQALKIREKLSRASAAYAETLIALARVARSKQQWDSAEQRFREGFDALEGQTAQLGGSEGARAGFRARYEDYYKDYVDLLMRRGKPELAFGVLEQSRARSLLEVLSAAHVDIRAGVDSSLLSLEKRLHGEISAKSDRRIQLLNDPHTADKLAAVDKEIEDLFTQQSLVKARIRESSPGYAALTRPEPLTAAQVQKLLDANTVLLEYSLGAERSYVFAAGRDSIVVRELPRRLAVEELARRVYESLTARNRLAQQTPAHGAASRRAADDNYARLSLELSKAVLGSVASEIQHKRLVIVSDGALQYIPFAALPDPAAGLATWRPLILDHEVVNLPSASVLALLRRQEDARRPALKTVAVLADPVFSAHDGRFGSGSNRTANDTRSRGLAPPVPADSLSAGDLADETLTRSVRDVGLAGLSRLPFTRLEAEAIMNLAPPGKSMNALDFEATRAAATSPELGQYRIVHFATHGLLDSEHPELSGLVFSLVDHQGKPQSGFLPLESVYNMNLPAELVVLSACETGLGKDISGEGLIGLTRGFMYAGASRVIASLWSVNDVATAELMTRFYQGVLHDGKPPAEALRRAQAQMWKTARWKSPYYWAAFQIQGEWK